MSGPSSSEGERVKPPTENGEPATELEALRQLLFAKESQQLETLRKRFEDPVLRAHAMSQVLPRAVALASAKDQQLTAALTPAVEAALKDSVRRDPSVLVSVVFPVIGSAIRKSVAEMFSRLLQSLNQTLEHSFSFRGLRWRLEAIQTGKPFAEVVLAHTLLYRVEQIFLIHKPTGLLLQHLSAPEVRTEDASIISGMLTAIQEFAQQSFHAGTTETLNTLEVGELNVWVESSPLATLAAVIRGQAPCEYRTVLQSALEIVHREHQAALESYTGDPAPFELARPGLESCFQARAAESPGRSPKVKQLVLALIAATVLLVWIGFTVRERFRWGAFLGRLRTEPGLVLTEYGKNGRRYFVSGLRDPLAPEPTSLLANYHLSTSQVVMHWTAFEALHPALVLQRAVARLEPPPTVTLDLQEGVLIARGHAPRTWKERLRARALGLPGVRALDDHGLSDEKPEALANILADIQQTRFLFEQGLQLAPGQEAGLDRLAGQVAGLGRELSQSGAPIRVVVVGHTDSSGTAEFNHRLSRERAEWVTRALIERGAPDHLLTSAGEADRQPARRETSELNRAQNRRVTFRVERPQPTDLSR